MAQFVLFCLMLLAWTSPTLSASLPETKNPERCVENICKNGGTCTNVGDASYSCKCKNGLFGRNCETECPSGGSALGMESREIKNDQLSASSVHYGAPAYGADMGRLHASTSWLSNGNSDGRWFQVDFKRTAIVNAVATQGRTGYPMWVTTYTLAYSNNGDNFLDYLENGRPKIFKANFNYLTVVKNTLIPEIKARFIRILPKGYQLYTAMRAEFYGCLKVTCADKPCKNEGTCTGVGNVSFSCKCKNGFFGSTCGTECPKGGSALGMKSGAIRDYQLSASSQYSNKPAYSADKGRLDGPTTWVSNGNTDGRWFQVDFKRKTIVNAVATQGKYNVDQWVKTYTLAYSNDGSHFLDYLENGRPKIFPANLDYKTAIKNILFPEIKARFLRILPKEYHGSTAMRVEFYGCPNVICSDNSCENGAVCTNVGQVTFTCKCKGGFFGPTCGSECEHDPEALGMESGLIKDNQLTASSIYNGAGSDAARGRLNQKTMWLTGSNMPNQWLQVDFEQRMVVSAVATQGGFGVPSFVTKYKLAFSNDGVTFKEYEQDGKVKEFAANYYDVVKNVLYPAINARFVRIFPTEFFYQRSMRVEFYGCLRGPYNRCEDKPCENGATCIYEGGLSFSCKCKEYFVGKTCEVELPSPCLPNPCKYNGQCEIIGNTYACRCRRDFGGRNCEHGQATCVAMGDPHYQGFNGNVFDFQGECHYVLAQDCSSQKMFTVVSNLTKCSFSATCNVALTIYLKANPETIISLDRQSRTAVINGVRVTSFPINRPGYILTNPSPTLVVLTTDSGLTVNWDFLAYATVIVSGRYKYKTCGLCGNYGSPGANPTIGLKCAPPLSQLGCTPSQTTHPLIEKCDLIKDKDSPFAACHSAVDPTDLIADCKYDTCRCTNPGRCLCNAVAAYTAQCARRGIVIDWRFEGTVLYPPMAHCAKTCPNEGEIFTECGLSCASTCRDMTRSIQCNEQCVPACQCPKGEVLNYEKRCVKKQDCPCPFEGKMVEAGESVEVGNCQTCTCNDGAIACVDDQECKDKGPCYSFPCKNDGICTAQGDTYICECADDYQGKNCKELKPKPCDSKPCENGGACSNDGDSFSCECQEYFQGKTCEESKPKPCDSSPCKNGAKCTNDGDLFLCRCTPGYIGQTCNTGVPDPCKPNPCKNCGQCEVVGNKFSCRCKPENGGPVCQHGQSKCEASGDPHYITFDKKKFDFQGACDYVFAEDCGAKKMFKVVSKNVKCGRRASCVAGVTVSFGHYVITFTRDRRTAIVNGVKLQKFPMKRTGFVITNPSRTWIHLNTDIGLAIRWNCKTILQVVVSGKYRDQMCGLCGDYDGNKGNDVAPTDLPCTPIIGPETCTPKATDWEIIDKCLLMEDSTSPFSSCNKLVDPTPIINDCKYDACSCDSPMDCVCASFADYTKQCSAQGEIIKWRFEESVYKPLKECAKTCKNEGEIFSECCSACAQTCRDLSSDIQCNEECVPGCHCPGDKVLNDENKCVPRKDCTCPHEGNILLPGESVDVGRCTTCTCSGGAMSCVEDRECSEKGPCERDSPPCKNQGICSEDGESFTCDCLGDYIGKTCEELRPKPCDSSPCLNGGVCTNEEIQFSCECTKYYEGDNCEVKKPKPCDSTPCQNGGECVDTEDSFYCRCTEDFKGETCKEHKPKPCDSSPCKNGGKCVNNDRTSFECECTEDFEGDTCEEPKSKACDSSPCKNGGKCVNNDRTSFECECTKDFEGDTCEEPKSKPCDSSPCKNGGKCVNNDRTSFECECTKVFKGDTCEEKAKLCDSSPCKNGGKCVSIDETSFECECTEDFVGDTCEVKCDTDKIDLLYVVDGSGSIKVKNFNTTKYFLAGLNKKLDIGPDKTEIALIEFGKPNKTNIMFNLGTKNTVEEVNEAVLKIKYFRSQTATGDALRRARVDVFNGQGGDRPDAPDVLILFTDGQATDRPNGRKTPDKNYQVRQAQLLKDYGVKLITVAMGTQKTTNKFKDKLKQMASKDSNGNPLYKRAEFSKMRSIANWLISKVCTN